jgi:hypothetical protein
MISLQSSAKEHDKFQNMVCHVMENEPKRPHGKVSATPSNEPAVRRSGSFCPQSRAMRWRACAM